MQQLGGSEVYYLSDERQSAKVTYCTIPLIIILKLPNYRDAEQIRGCPGPGMGQGGVTLRGCIRERLCGDGTLLYPDCSGGYIIYVGSDCIDIHTHIHTQQMSACEN